MSLLLQTALARVNRRITQDELSRHGLSFLAGRDGGCVVGAVEPRFGSALQTVFDAGQGPHVALGPCRCGKTAGVIIPTLNSWRGNAFAFDIRGELQAQTGALREFAMGQRIVCFQPFAEVAGATFNPIDELRDDTAGLVATAYDIALALVPSGADEVWRERARLLIVAFSLAAGARGESLGDVYDAMSKYTRDEDERAETGRIIPIFDAMDIEQDSPRFREIDRILLAHCQESAKIRLSVLAVALNALEVFSDARLRAATSTSSFTPQELLSERGMTLYFGLQPSDLARGRVVGRLLLRQLIRHVHARGNIGAGRPMLLQLDEVTALDELGFLIEAAGYLGAYGVKLQVSAESVEAFLRLCGSDGEAFMNASTLTLFRPASLHDRVPSRTALEVKDWHALAQNHVFVRGTQKEVVRMRSALYFDQPFR